MAEAKPPQSGPGANPAAAGAPTNPYRNYRYRVTVAQGGIEGHFTRMEGLGMRVHPIRYAEGGSDGRVHQLVGPVEYTEVRLHYGIVSTDQAGLWTWLQASQTNQSDRRNVMIDLLGPDPNDVYGYVLEEAWICEWMMAPLDGLGRDFAVETIALAYQSISRNKGR
jgi:phage tail-like protein